MFCTMQTRYWAVETLPEDRVIPGWLTDQDFQEKISGNHSENFWTPITTVEWKDFTSSNRTAKANTSKGKTIEVKVQRDILGFLLAKSQELSATIQMEECLKYPLCAVELSIAHGDGRKRKTNKSALLPYIPPPETTPSSNLKAEKVYTIFVTVNVFWGTVVNRMPPWVAGVNNSSSS